MLYIVVIETDEKDRENHVRAEFRNPTSAWSFYYAHVDRIANLSCKVDMFLYYQKGWTLEKREEWSNYREPHEERQI